MRIEYKLQEWNGGKVWVEEAYPNILFAKDGEIYDIAGMKTIVKWSIVYSSVQRVSSYNYEVENNSIHR